MAVHGEICSLSPNIHVSPSPKIPSFRENNPGLYCPFLKIQTTFTIAGDGGTEDGGTEEMGRGCGGGKGCSCLCFQQHQRPV